MLRHKRTKVAEPTEDNLEIYASLSNNLELLREQFKDCSDIVISQSKQRAGKTHASFLSTG